MIQISATAKQEIRRLGQHQTPFPIIRISLAPGGCLDWLYCLDFQVEDQFNPEHDTLYAVDDLRVSIAKQHQQYLAHLSIDYSEDLMGGGFRFENPSAQGHCGCGHSFAVEAEGAGAPPSESAI